MGISLLNIERKRDYFHEVSASIFRHAFTSTFTHLQTDWQLAIRVQMFVQQWLDVDHATSAHWTPYYIRPIQSQKLT